MTPWIAATAMIAVPQSYSWEDIVQKGLQDAKFTAVVVRSSRAELRKINEDFAQSYQFSSTQAWLKEPFRIRMEAEVEDVKLIYIMNGTRKYYKVGRAPGIPIDVKNEPGKRQTVFDFGILTPSLFQELFTAKFVRVDRESGDLVFDMEYQKPRYDDTSRHRIWVDKERLYVKRRVWFNQQGRQLATFVYENPKRENGVWLATRGTVYNVENKVAGITEYRSIAVNTGLADTLFKF